MTYDCRYSTMHGMPVTGGRGFRSLKPLWHIVSRLKWVPVEEIVKDLQGNTKMTYIAERGDGKSDIKFE